MHGGSVVTSKVAIGGREAREGEGEAHCWPNKPKRSRSSLDQAGSKTPKAIKTKEKATTG